MGMSASQARLLSITTRLTNNEFRAQTITNSKLRLADKSTEACQEYMDALNTQKLVYNYYDDNGNYTQQNLTPGLVYTYSPLKNQYAMINNAGRILVTSADAKNYEETDNLMSFLDRYGLVDNVEAANKYQDLLKQYDIDKAVYEQEMIEYNEKLQKYNEDYAKWEIDKQNPNLYDDFVAIVGTSEAPLSCYSNALSGAAGCYMHLLAHLIDYTGGNSSSTQDYTTSIGTIMNMGGNYIFGSAINSGGLSPQFAPLSEALNNPQKVCDGYDDNRFKGVGENDPRPEKYNMLEDKRQNGEVPTNFDILTSDYIETDNGDGTYSYSLKTVKQKCIDIQYVLDNGIYSNYEDMKSVLINLTDGDLNCFAKEPDPIGEPPIPPVEPEKPTYDFELNDQAKGQWYINLWHMMNGSDSANFVEKINYQYDADSAEQNIFVVKDALKDSNKSNYEIIDEHLLNSNTWLQFALEHGVIELRQASYFNPTEDDGKTPELTSKGITWKSISYSSTSDMVLIEDELAIAKAEIKYKNATQEIEHQDKKYDQDLKKLDTEHTALQTEYESLKEVVNKNVDRSFKAFS